MDTMNLFRIASLRICYKDRQCTYNENWGAFVQPLLLCKAISITYSVRVFVALTIRQAMRFRHIIIFGTFGCTIFFPHYLTLTRFSEKTLLGIKCLFWFSLQHLS